MAKLVLKLEFKTNGVSMKKDVFILFVILFVFPAFAQSSKGKIIEGIKIKSEILGEDIRYTVYLPYDYDTSNKYYPVVYLLHGYTDNDMGWVQFGEIDRLANDAIESGEITPMIIVMPDAGVSWYINNFDNSVRYEDFFIKEFIPQVERKYRVRTEKRYRGIAGLSMGGFGTLIYTLKHPDLFSACAPFSAAIYTKEFVKNISESRWQKVESVLYGPDLKGEERITDHWISYNPLEIIKNGDAEKFKSVRYYIDCGDGDFLSEGNSELHILMTEKEIPHEYRVRDGKHNWTYWRTGIIDGLKFIGQSFHQE